MSVPNSYSSFHPIPPTTAYQGQNIFLVVGEVTRKDELHTTALEILAARLDRTCTFSKGSTFIENL